MSTDRLIDQLLQQQILRTSPGILQGQQGFTQQPPQRESFLDSPGLSSALLRLGSTLAVAGQRGVGTAAGLSLGLGEFGGELSRVEAAQAEARTKQIADIQDLLSLQISRANLGQIREEADLRRERRTDLEAAISERPELQALLDVGGVEEIQSILAAEAVPGERETQKDVTGRLRFLDTGEPVFADVDVPFEPPPGVDIPTGFVPVRDESAPAGIRVERLEGFEAAEGLDLTPGEKKTDEIFAQTFSDFSLAGGFAAVESNLAKLENAVTRLRSGENLTGPIIGALSLEQRALINPASVDIEEIIAQVSQLNLKAILGGQFGEKEGDRLIARAYNPRLDEKINADRVQRLIDQMRAQATAKKGAVDFFAANGTVKGFDLKLPTFADFDPERDIQARVQDTTGGFDPSLLQFMSPEDRALFE